MENLLSSPILYSLALTLIHFLWQGALVALALKILLTITPYRKSQLRYVWTAGAMLCNLALPLITFFLIYQPEYNQLTNQFATSAIVQNGLMQSSPSSIAWYQDAIDILPYVSMSWITVVMLLASKLFIELYNVNQLPRIGTSAADEKLTERFNALVERINLKKPPQLLISLKTEVPMAIGWLKPVVLIPAAMLTGLTPAQLDMLILHELAHIRRHDYLVNFIQTLVETSLFFHPSVRWVSKQMRNEREYCSDDIAVKIAGSPIAYAHTLADTASLCRKHRHHSIPSMAMAASGGDLKQRVVRLVDQNHHCSNTDDSGKWLASALIIFSVFAVAIKPYLSTPVIDFSSGRISLFHSASEYIKQQPVDASTLSATSIAQRLLKKTLLVDEEPITLDKIAPSMEEMISVVNTTKTTKAQISGDFSNVKLSTPKNEVESKVDVKVSKNNTKLASKTPEKSSLLSAPVASTILAKPNKSISELAFERTDSTKVNSSLANPYSNQVAELTNEPVFTREEDSINTFDLSKFKRALPVTKTAFPIVKSTPIVISEEKEHIISPVKAKLLSSTDPRYPSTAKRKGLELDVAVNFTIDKNGRVKNIEFEKKSKVNYFRSVIKAAMEKWRFLPASVNNKPVDSKMSKIFSFSLLK